MRPDATTRTAPVRFAAMTLPIAGLLLMSVQPSAAQDARNAASNSGSACAGDNGGITLSPGFCATVFADNVGHARHMVVAPNGVVYVNTWSGRYYANTENAKAPDGGFLLALQDTTGSGRADKVVRFGPGVESGNAGGTGIALYNGALFAETNDRIVRYALPPGAIAPTGAPEVVVSGLPLTGDHPMHPFKIDAQGALYVDLGSATNACQRQNRIPNSPGIQPCTELETRAGIWRYDANRTGQQFSPAERFATGLRNGEGIAFDSAGRIFATQHGRDQLRENWSAALHRGAGRQRAGGRACSAGTRRRLRLAVLLLRSEPAEARPGAGIWRRRRQGDRAVRRQASARRRVSRALGAQRPRHLRRAAIPGAYRGGAFIAFHGSWNRAPSPQGGYNVVFQPLADGKPSGNYVVFADGFAGASKEPGRAAHRPSGLAVGPDGALYVSDDQRGRIWRIVFRGGTAVTAIAPAPAPAGGSASTAAAGPPEGVHPDAGSQIAALPVPAGATPADVALGSRIYGAGTCAGCHGSDAKGTPLGPDLTSAKWLWGDGSVQSIAKIITDGVPNPKEFRSPMPPMGGTQLSASEVSAVADYIWALGHGSGASTGQAR